jgi:hypothetical protein
LAELFGLRLGEVSAGQPLQVTGVRAGNGIFHGGSPRGKGTNITPRLYDGGEKNLF